MENGTMVFRLLADLVVAVHFSFIVFIAVGGLLVWRRPSLVRLHVPAVVWGIGIITVGFPCPLTSLEKHLRGRAGDQGYHGGFIDRYVEGVIYPGALTNLARALVAVAILVGYAGVFSRRRHRPAGAAGDSQASLTHR
jgi:hypothetical protein